MNLVAKKNNLGELISEESEKVRGEKCVEIEMNKYFIVKIGFGHA